MQLTISTGSITEAVALSLQIPEFAIAHLNITVETERYRRRLGNKRQLILIAFINGEAAGFKVGYERYNQHTFYSFMGGVLPRFRRLGVAQALAHEQEQWAKSNGFTQIVCKTRNRFTNMLLFAIGNGFKIVGVKRVSTIEDYRIHLQKRLL